MEPLAESIELIRIQQRGLKALGGKNVAVPDDYIGWILPAVTGVKEVLEEQRASLIYATAPPYSNLLVGAIGSRMFNLPFISDFRDPWTRIDLSYWIRSKPFLSTVNRFLEKSVLRTSEKVIMVDEKQYWSEYFVDPDQVSDKVVTITNGFDEEDFPKHANGDSDVGRERFVITYVGTIYDEECFQNLVRPLELWSQEYPDDLKNVIFEYAGNNALYFDKFGPFPFKLVNHDYVSHGDAIALRANSSVQLFAQPHYFKPHVFSGKIFEMIRVGVPIIAFTDLSGAVARLVEKSGTGFVVRSTDFDSAARLLKGLYEDWRRGIPSIHPNGELISQYKRENLSKQLSELLEEVLEQNRLVP
jgi:glycosyltransferase involved in cell wall biosynthesis